MSGWNTTILLTFLGAGVGGAAGASGGGVGAPGSRCGAVAPPLPTSTGEVAGGEGALGGGRQAPRGGGATAALVKISETIPQEKPGMAG